MESKERKLRNYIKELRSVVVAFSGGVDSTLLLKTALDELGKDKVLAVIGRSKTYPAKEVAAARKLAEKLGVRCRIIDTEELANDNFRSNPIDRCFYCKDELFFKLNKIAEEEGYAHVADGSNIDDTSDFRPGRQAAQKQKVLSPLQEAGLRKEEIRTLAKKIGLENWDKPSLACLASRFPYSQAIDKIKLERVEKAESFLENLGIMQVRVRLDKDTARIEVLPGDFQLVIQNSRKISDYFKKLGFVYIALDLEGYKSGSMNKALPQLGDVSHA